MTDIADLLKQAAKAVDDADLPEDLRPLAFTKAVELLSGAAPVAAAPITPTVTGTSGAAAPLAGGEGSSDERLAAIATRLGLPLDLVDQIYGITADGELEILISSNRIDTAKSRGAQELAALMAVGRQAAGLDATGWTAVETIRPLCQEFNRFDSGNFGSTMAGMDSAFHAHVRGKGRGREIRMTRDSLESVAALIRRLTGTAES